MSFHGKETRQQHKRNYVTTCGEKASSTNGENSNLTEGKTHAFFNLEALARKKPNRFIPVNSSSKVID